MIAKRHVAVFLSYILTASFCLAGPQEDANKLFVEAGLLWRSYETVTTDRPHDIESRASLLTEISRKLHSIINNFPESDLAVKLIIGPVGDLSIEKIDALTSNIAKSRPSQDNEGTQNQQTTASPKAASCIPECLQNILMEAINIAQQLEPPDRLEVLVAIAKAQKATGDKRGAATTEIDLSESAAEALILTASHADAIDRFRELAAVSQSLKEAENSAIAQIAATTALEASTAAIASFETLDSEAEKAVYLAVIYMAFMDTVDGLPKSALPRAFDLIQEVENEVLREELTVYITYAFAAVGDVSNAVKGAGYVKDVDQLSHIFSDIAAALAAAGTFSEIAEALSIARTVGDPADRARALIKIAEAQITVGDTANGRITLGEALRSAQIIADPANRSSSLAVLAATQILAGDIANGEITLAEAIRLTQIVENPADRARALIKIAEAQIKVGEMANSQLALAEALNTARTVEDPADRARALITIAEVQITIGDTANSRITLGEALRSAYESRNNALRDRMIPEVAERQAAIGDAASAIQTARRASPRRARALALTRVALVLASDQDHHDVMLNREK